MKIKEWAEEDRPREKMLLKGVSALSNAELLAILLRSGNAEESAVQLARQVLSSVADNLHALGRLTFADLRKFKGIGPTKAVTIAAALELGKRRGNSEQPERPVIRSSRDAWLLFQPLLADLPHEELWIALTNRANRVVQTIKISQGGTGETVADLRIILKAAIQALAQGMVLCHNHPSGHCRPSTQDDTLTLRLQKAAQLVEITLLDHIIVTDRAYYSYADEGKL